MASPVPRDPTITPEMRRFLDDLARGTSIFDNKTAAEATALLNVFTSLLKGLAPASGGGTTNFLRADATWADPLSDAVAWTSYTPAITAGSGTFTTVSATGKYKQIGKTVHVQMVITITTNGTAATYIVATLPIAQSGTFAYYGRANSVAFKGLAGVTLGSGNILISMYDGSYPGVNGETLSISGTYETT